MSDVIINKQIQELDLRKFTNEELFNFFEEVCKENPLLEVSLEESVIFLEDIQINPELEQQKLEDLDAYVDDAPIPEWEELVVEKQISLYDFLLNQLYAAYRKTDLRDKAEYLLKFIDDRGYLTIELDKAAEELETNHIVMLDALTLIQILDPRGVGARNQKEFYQLYVDRDPKAPEMAYYILESYYDLLMEEKYNQILMAQEIGEDALMEMSTYLKGLPTEINFDQIRDTFQARPVVSTIQIAREQDHIVYRLNEIGKPSLSIDLDYEYELAGIEDDEARAYVLTKKAEAETLIEKYRQRNQFLLKLGRILSEELIGFFMDQESRLPKVSKTHFLSELSIDEEDFDAIVDKLIIESPRGTLLGRQLDFK